MNIDLNIIDEAWNDGSYLEVTLKDGVAVVDPTQPPEAAFFECANVYDPQQILDPDPVIIFYKDILSLRKISI